VPLWRRALHGRTWIFLVGLGIIAVAVLVFVNQRKSASSLAAGSPAPTGKFTTLNAKTVDVSSFLGKPTLLWFVTTWCGSCQTGTQAMAQKIRQLKSDGVRVVELELYNNLGGSGPDLASFRKMYGGKASYNPDWIWGAASQRLSFAYDPKAYLDIYYLLDSQGNISYINGSPASTMNSLLQAAGQVT
jgi:thiol-disulfide isomerase/thioredoxin